MRIAADPCRIGKPGRRPFRHVLLEQIGHALLAVERPAQCRIDIGQMRFREMVGGGSRFVLALRREIRLEERGHFRCCVRGNDDLRIKRLGAQWNYRERQRGSGSANDRGVFHKSPPCSLSVNVTAARAHCLHVFNLALLPTRYAQLLMVKSCRGRRGRVTETCKVLGTKAMDKPAQKNAHHLQGATGPWEVVIGMEVHAQVTSHSKLFSGASTEFGGEPNAHVSLVDAAMPGMLPVINQECVRQAVRSGLGLNATINLRSVFDRKNYFYPDSPQGYQISQYKSPIVGEGTVELAGGDSATIGIERLHLEQDAGKLLHDQSPDSSFVDLNRCGVGLMEIVSKPDIRSSEQAKAYVTKIRSILRYLGTCDGDMEKGSLRADVNVSVRKPGAPLGTRCEIKNMNSISFIGDAIEHEARRQIEILEDGGAIDQETRLYDPGLGETRSMRTKEEAHDYRYFPDPDLLPLEFTQQYVDGLKAALPELPDQKKARFIAEFGLSLYDASVLVAERDSAVFYETVLAGLGNRKRDGKLAANWVINELFGRLNKEGRDITGSPVTAAQLAAIVDLIGEATISGKIAKDLFEIVWQEGGDPRALVEARGMKQVTDLGAIEKVVDDIIAANPDKVAQARAKPAAIQWFVGQVMKSSGGKANPQAVNELLKSKLGL